MSSIPSEQALAVGTPVEVRNRYLGTWSSGFEIHASTDQGCVLRRTSDGVVLEGIVLFEDVRLVETSRRSATTEGMWLVETSRRPPHEGIGPERTAVLVAEDNEPVRASIANVLTGAGYAVFEATDGLSALGVLAWAPIDVLLLDLAMPTYSGLFVLRHIDPVPPVVIVYSGFTLQSPDELANEIGSKVFRYVQKPVAPVDLLSTVSDAVRELVGTGRR